MAKFVDDTFTGTTGTDLESHTGETGATWTKHSSTSTGNLRLGGDGTANTISPTVAASSMYFASGSPATAEYNVKSDITRVGSTASNIAFVVGRVDVSANTYYAAGYDFGSGAWVIQKRVAGTATTLGTLSEAFNASETRSIEFEIRDAAKKLFVNGVEKVSTPDNTITAAGKVGIRASGYTASLAYARFDNFSASDPAGGGNAAPTFPGPNIGNQSGTVGTPGSLNIASRFSDSDALTFSAVGSWPPGITVSSAGLISGTPTTAGTYANLKVRATDTVAQTVDSDTFSFTINAAAQLVTAANSQQVNAASSGSVTQSVGGTIQLPPLSEWETGNLLPSQAGITVWINDEESGALMVKLTGISTAAVTAAFSPISHVSLVPGTPYSVRTRLANGAQYTWTYLAS